MMNLHKIRIVTVDSFMSTPLQGFDPLYSEFRSASINQVPVLRMFGSIPSGKITGEKICVHIHGVFPYLYIPYDGNEDANSLMYKIAINIDKAVNISLNQATSNMQHVYKISLVQGIPMYGYHCKEHQFFKIYLYNPILLRKVTALLMNESTLGKLYQPHEAHLNFTLQFMIDYNLHGMSDMILSKIKYRQGSEGIQIDPDMFLPHTVCKLTKCQLEGDCLADDIVNREEVASGVIGANPGIAALWADERQRRRNNNMDSQIPHLLELKRTRPPTSSHLIFKQALMDRLSIFSNEKNVVNKLNLSVYPAESPRNNEIQNASMVESQNYSSLSDSTLIDSSLDFDSSNMNITFDEDAQQLLSVLNDLEQQAFDRFEEDSILTQVVKEQDDLEENELDFSLSVEDPVTPTKLVISKDDEDDDDLDTTLIPQLDGGCDESMPAISSKYKSKVLFIKLTRLESRDVEIKLTKIKVNEKKKQTRCNYKATKSPRQIRQIRMKKDKKEITSFLFQIKKRMRYEKLAVILRKLRKRNNEIFLLLEKNHPPKFNLRPKGYDQKQVCLKESSKVNVLNDIIIKLGEYVEPTLHLTVRLPKKIHYLFNYNGNDLPEVVQIPNTVLKHGKINQFVKSYISTHSNDVNDINDELVLIKEEPNDVKKSDNDLEIAVRELNENLNWHLKNLFSNEIKEEIRFSCLEDRAKALQSLKCLNTDDEDCFIVENNNLPDDTNKKLKFINDHSHSKTDTNTIICIDGAFDNSSSSDLSADEEKSPKKPTKRKSKYKPLPITIQKSPKVSSNSFTEPVGNDADSVFDTCETAKTPLKKETKSVCDKIKRQLFTKTSNETIIEERLVCSYSTKSTPTFKKSIESELKDESNSSIISSNSSLFSDDSNDKNDLTIAELYDKTTHNEPKAGCSKFLTPNQILSGSSTKSTELITPYQLLQDETNLDELVIIRAKNRAPTRRELLNSGIPYVTNFPPFYSDVRDVTGSVEVGFNTLKINSKTTAHLINFQSQTDALNQYRSNKIESSSGKVTKSNINNLLLSYCDDSDCIITPLNKPPSLESIYKWISNNKNNSKKSVNENKVDKIKIFVRSKSPGLGDDNEEDDDEINMSITLSPKISQDNNSQITGVTVNRSVQNLQNARAIIEHQNLTVLNMELHARTRADLKPDPKHDSIRAIFYAILHDVPEPNTKGRNIKGVVVINNSLLGYTTPLLNGCNYDFDNVTYVESETDLIDEFIKIINYWNPDILSGYEIELLSWGYFIERGFVLGCNVKKQLSRVVDDVHNNREGDLSQLHITGRIVLDVWRLMRHEMSMQSYTFESVVYHVLKKRLPCYSFKDLSFWFDHRSQLYRHKTIKYYLIKVAGVLDLFDKLDFLNRTSELARLFGIQFFEVLSRGSQFRVESMMLRLAKPLNYIAVSPSVQQRAHMKAPEFIALVMEPESKFYVDPVIVLDFQSLYPSIIIAYNYCFTTCVGRVEYLGKSGPFTFGATQLKVSRARLKKLLQRNQLNFSPCGVGFVKKEVRDGIMPRMLREILDTRLMVKNSMKENKEDRIIQKVLHNRQLGLKLIANVTYGYTAANFSGRMPAVELGDSVVSKGRETLQRAIEMVEKTPEWGARVVYGDTDSLFVLVPGKSREYAFEVGKKIAEAVTNDNPDPIKLKLEKVYQPCILQTKKRYVGYMYESPDQVDPVYEAKGIETVRRDGCPAVSKMLEKCLRILFETKDVSLVKQYVLKQFNKIISGRVSIQDLTFAKEYRGASGYRPNACVPALELTKKWTAIDRRNEPRSGERVPYVIINGPPGLPLIRSVRSPMDLLNDPSLKPNAVYYITRVIIPPINRCFNLIGADLHVWYNQMPRKKIQSFATSVSPKKKTTISQYFSTSNCVSCEQEQTQNGICDNCVKQPQKTVCILMEKLRMWELNHGNINKICETCSSFIHDTKCISLDCPVFYKRVQTGRDLQQSHFIRQLLDSTNFEF